MGSVAENQPVVWQVLAITQGHDLLFAVYGLRVSRDIFDPQFVEPALVLNEQVVFGNLAGKITGEVQSEVGQGRLPGDEGDLDVSRLPTGLLGCRQAGNAGAKDNQFLYVCDLDRGLRGFVRVK